MNAKKPEKRTANIIGDLFFLALILAFIIPSFGFPAKSRFLPLVIGTICLVLSLVQVYLTFSGKAKEPEEKPLVDTSTMEMGDHWIQTQGNIWQAVGWLIFMVILIQFFGFYVTIPVFLTLFVRVAGKEKWVAAILTGLISVVSIYLLFDRFLHIDLYPGLFFSMITG